MADSSRRLWHLAVSSMVMMLSSPILASIGDPSLSPTPPMGFNDWARFECNINQTLFVETADAMAANGLLAAGYNRINLDDCWPAHERAPNGSLQWNETLFPDGLIWLGQYVKSKGFHFGIYEDAGNATCGGYPGTRGHEVLDAKTFESWGIDYLKLDGCNVYPSTEQTYQNIYGDWHKVLTGLEHPLIFSESAPAYFSGYKNKTHWYEVMDWVPLYGELARHSTDIAVYGLYKENIKYWESILTNYGYEVLLARYQQPGYYNDPDFLITGFPWLTLDEKMSHFGLWASFSAPLIISSYVPELSAAEIKFLTNADVIAIDQDPLALQATLVSQDGYFDVLTKSLSNGDRLLTVLNRGAKTNHTAIDMARLGLPAGSKSYTAKNLWTGKTQTVSNSIAIALPSHATALYRLSGVSSVTPTGMLFNTATKECMAAQGKTAIFTDCDGSDEQVWQATEQGNISPLSAINSCLQSTKAGKLQLVGCSTSDKNAQWTYHVTGNLINAATGDCLQQHGGQATTSACGYEQNNQVFGLPSGVNVVRGSVV